MEGERLQQKYIVAEQPPWYFASDNEQAFSCESTQGLFDRVVELMIRKQEELSTCRYMPKTVYKMIRAAVLKDVDIIQQKPSRSLLLALMDLVDMEGGNDFESVVDKAGLKHVLLADCNYTSFYIPKKEMVCTTGKKVIPIVTQYSEEPYFFYCDRPRSMVGTYGVPLPKTDPEQEVGCFLQEVLFVPGPKSLDLLKVVTENKFAFWDMSLEVPTHPTALTPSFQQIQPCQLLRTEDKFLSTQSNKEAPASHVEQIHPMCCVVGTGDQLERKVHETSLDCFTEAQVICSLKNFHYEAGGTRTVYFRRNSKLLYGKQVNMVPVVALREEQRKAPELYVSTTLKFCRAVKGSCIEGKGTLLSCWNETLKEFQRDSFIFGSHIYQEIQNAALTGFIKRVNPNSWCNYLPRHLESMIKDPIMIEVVELAIKLMDGKIPNAFAVAELLYCPIEKVQKCLKVWEMYSTDQKFRRALLRKRTSMIEDQMRREWAKLSRITLAYVRQKHGTDSREAATCAELFKSQSPDQVTKAQKMWQSLIEHDTKKGNKDKELAQLYSSAKVLFLKLCTYQNKKKAQVEEEENKKKAVVEEEKEEEKEEEEENTAASINEEENTLYSIVTPDPVPVSTWLKNLSTLLLSEPWLNGDTLRREAVCTLLGLDNTLLDKRHHDVLHNWVINNRSIVYILQKNKLPDRLSTALVHCLKTTSTANWRDKILLSFQGSTQAQPRGQSVAKPFGMSQINPQSADATKGARSGSKTGRKAKGMQAHGVRSCTTGGGFYLSHAKEVSVRIEDHRNRHDDNDDDILGEEPEATMDYHNIESLDDYDYDDDFINDGLIEEKSSSDQDEDRDTVRTPQVEKRGKGAKSKNQRERVIKPPSDSSEEDDNKSIEPHKKRVKRTRPDKTKDRLSRSGKVVKKKSEECSERTRAKLDKRNKGTKPTRYTRRMLNPDSPPGRNRLSEFWFWFVAPEMKGAHFFPGDTDSDSEGGLQRKITQRDALNSTVRQKLRKTEASSENQAAWGTFQQESLNCKRKRAWDCQEKRKLNRKHPRCAERADTLPPEPASNSTFSISSYSSCFSSSSSSDEEEDRHRDEEGECQNGGGEEKGGSDGRGRQGRERGGLRQGRRGKDSHLDFDFGRGNTGCGEPETDPGKRAYIVSM